MTDDGRVERVARAIQSARAEYFSTPPDYSPERMDLFRAYARAAIAAAEPRWQPIATAPTDGAVIIVGRPKRASRESYWDRFCWHNCNFEPTHWMPLPPPPGDDNE